MSATDTPAVAGVEAQAVEAAPMQGSTQDFCYRTQEDHYWASHTLGGAPIWVRICTLCQHIDWDGLQEQADALRAQVLAEVQGALRDDRLAEVVAMATGTHHIDRLLPKDADGGERCVCGVGVSLADGPDWDDHMAAMSLAATADYLRDTLAGDGGEA